MGTRKRKRNDDDSKGSKKRKVIGSESFFPHVPEEANADNLYGLRVFYWKKFCEAYSQLSKNESEIFGFPSEPHINVLNNLSEDLIKEQKKLLFFQASGLEKNDLSFFQKLEPQPHEVALFMDENESEEEHLEHNGEETENKSIAREKSIFDFIFSAEQKFLYLFPRYRIYTKSFLRNRKFSRNLKDAVQNLELALDASREIERIVCQVCSKRVFMAEKTKQEIDELQLNRPANVPDKFWAQRYRLFSKFDAGIEIGCPEAWFSVTPEAISNSIADRCKNFDSIIDPFCGVGGNAIAFAKHCKHVIAIDINENAIAACRKNAKIYGVEKNIETIVGDFFTFKNTLKADCIFLGPPWGGVSYSDGVYDIHSMGSNLDLEEIVKVAKNMAKNIILCLPKNCDFVQLHKLKKIIGANKIEVQQNMLFSKCKMWTVYFGNNFGK